MASFTYTKLLQRDIFQFPIFFTLYRCKEVVKMWKNISHALDCVSCIHFCSHHILTCPHLYNRGGGGHWGLSNIPTPQTIDGEHRNTAKKFNKTPSPHFFMSHVKKNILVGSKSQIRKKKIHFTVHRT